MMKCPLVRASQHEVAHAVMARLRGLAATALEVDGEGGGFYHGCGSVIRTHDALEITLAGMAWEACAWASRPLRGYDWDLLCETFGDASEAKQLLESHPYLRPFSVKPLRPKSISDSLDHHLESVGKKLYPHRQLIVTIGEQLKDKLFLTAGDMESFFQPGDLS